MENNNGVEFLFPGRTVTIEGGKETLLFLLRQCTGYRTAEEIASAVCEQTGHNKEEVWEVMEELLARHILVDANRYYLLFHMASENPMPFLRELSEEDTTRMLREGESPLVPFPSSRYTALEQLLEKRESVRQFSGEPLSFDELSRLAWAVYGRIKRSEKFPESSIGLGTVPSGGAMYPLRLFVLDRKGPSGWMVYIGYPKGLQVRSLVSKQQAIHALGEDSILEGAAAVYILTCDFQRIIQKYGNRGYRFALLEAGHAAQNAYLWCAEQNLGVVEVGGFLDEELANLLLLSYPRQAPLTALIIGRRKS
ncbi:MAG: SagB/ThcOx family dehydrogenase [Patescibacteria group bacterium]